MSRTKFPMRNRPQSFAFTLLLGSLGAILPLSIDMGLPALSSVIDHELICAGTNGYVTPAVDASLLLP